VPARFRLTQTGSQAFVDVLVEMTLELRVKLLTSPARGEERAESHPKRTQFLHLAS
jgi:hypothetical protein